MSVSMQRAAPAAGRRMSAKSLDRQLARFPRTIRGLVTALAARDPRLADLAFSFPGLLFALAVRRAGFDCRAAIAAVRAGECLDRIAGLADVPMWLRQLPPEAFENALGQLPRTTSFSTKIGNHRPTAVGHAQAWLENVTLAADVADEAVAVWIARVANQVIYLRDYDVRRVSLWAWYAQRNDTLAGELNPRPWTSQMSFETAVDYADAFFNAIKEHLEAFSPSTHDPWFEAGVVDGFTFEPISSSTALAKAAAAMNNCVRTYHQDISENRLQLWSVSDGRTMVGMLALGRVDHVEPYPVITQLRGYGNANVSRELYAATVRWWLSQRSIAARRMQASNENERWLDQELWREFWRPYWLEKQRIPSWLPLVISHDRVMLW